MHTPTQTPHSHLRPHTYAGPQMHIRTKCLIQQNYYIRVIKKKKSYTHLSGRISGNRKQYCVKKNQVAEEFKQWLHLYQLKSANICTKLRGKAREQQTRIQGSAFFRGGELFHHAEASDILFPYTSKDALVTFQWFPKHLVILDGGQKVSIL